MDPIPQTAASGAAATQELPAVPAEPARRARLPATLPLIRHAGFAIAVGVSAVLNTHRLAENGYANIFYSAGVKSMLRSLHNFVFVAFDPGGLIAVDKPPLGLWLQAASAYLFGFSPTSLLLPEALAGVLAVALIYVIVARRLGPIAAFASSMALAVFPSFVAVSRDNGVDPLLILLMVMACGAGLRAIEGGRMRWLLASAVFVGLAFNTKTLAAWLVVPGIAAGWIVCAPQPLLGRAWRLLAAGALMLVVSFAWIAYVEATPALERPYVGGSTDNTQLGLTFGYNGFGRVEGQSGGPGQVTTLPGARVPAPKRALPKTARQRVEYQAYLKRLAEIAAAQHATYLPSGRYKNPIPFGSKPSPVRLFGKGLGDQAGWMVPFALFGLIALARLVWLTRRRPGRADASGDDPPTGLRPQAGAPPQAEAAPGTSPADKAWRRDPRLAALFVLGGWFLVEAIVLSMSKGIVHPYYVSALAPATGAMAGGGAVALVALRRGPRPAWAIALAALAVFGTVAVQIVLLKREAYMGWFIPVLVGAGALGVGLMAARKSLAGPALAATFCVLLIAPTAYSATTWYFPVEGTFPAAGPKAAGGPGGYGVDARTVAVDRALLDWVESHHPGRRWTLLTVASDTAGPFILLGTDAAAVGGYSGTDPALDGKQLAHYVRTGEARYVVLGGVFSTRGGNEATRAVLAGCTQLRPSQWHSPSTYSNGLTLFDCAGRERELERPLPPPPTGVPH
jgi:4-amino-4-deoxy-L-arabinose transferase-like glycosyltransferase